MALRDLVLYNFRWKLTALLLATLVWFVIKFAIYKESLGGRGQILTQQPVMVLKTPDDNRIFRVLPPSVDLVVRSPQELKTGDLEVFVNLTALPDVQTAFKQVLVRGSDAARIVEVKPWGVTVEQLSGTDQSLTNSLRKP
jgi:hypothetical protein